METPSFLSPENNVNFVAIKIITIIYINVKTKCTSKNDKI